MSSTRLRKLLVLGLLVLAGLAVVGTSAAAGGERNRLRLR